MVTKGENSNKSSMTGSSEKIPLIDPAESKNEKNKVMKIEPEIIRRENSQTSYSNEARVVRRPQEVISEQIQFDGQDDIRKHAMVLAPKGGKPKVKARKSFGISLIFQSFDKPLRVK
jgi:hypothetical protein